MLDHLLSPGDVTGNKTISWLSYGTFFWNDTVMFERTNINIYKVLGPRILNSQLLCCCPSFVDRARCLLFTKSQQRRIKTNPGLCSSPKPNFSFQWWEVFLFNGLYYFLSKEAFLRAYCFELLNTRWFIEDYVAEINLVKKKKKSKELVFSDPSDDSGFCPRLATELITWLRQAESVPPPSPEKNEPAGSGRRLG